MGPRITSNRTLIGLTVLTGTIYSFALLFKFDYLSGPNWIRAYLSDVMCLTFLLPLTLLMVRLIPKWRNFEFKPVHLIFIWAYISLVFEVLLPRFDGKFTGDIWDGAAYAAGVVAYVFITSIARRKAKV